MIRSVASHTGSPIEIAISQLIVGAFFFAMRSCEYLHVPSGESRKTRVLRIRDIRFFHKHIPLKHTAPNLVDADVVAITFTSQKNEERYEVVNQFKTDDPVLCPVKAWAAIITRITSYKQSTDDSTVNCYCSGKSLVQLTSANVRTALRTAVLTIGIDRLGFGTDDVGTHSLRSGAAMAMYLAKEPVYTIMLLGRWSSDAFLKYIRKQVQDFSIGVSGRMLSVEESYMTPDINPADPRIRNHPLNSTLRNNAGPNAPFQNHIPTFALFN